MFVEVTGEKLVGGPPILNRIKDDNEMNRHREKIFHKIICFGPWCINLVQSNLSGSFCEALFRPNLSLAKFAIRHFPQ